MAFNAGSVTANLELGVSSFVASLDKATKALDSFGQEGKHAESGLLSFGGALGTLRDLAIVVPEAFHLVREAISAVTEVVWGAIEASANLELKTIQLGAALAANGERNVPQATEEMAKYADELEKTTGFSDATVLSVERQLAQFGLQGEKLKEATKATLDYASITGQDATEAGRLLGQTLDGNLGRLGRQIPALQTLTAEQLKSGKAFELLADQYGGSAEKIGQTTLGLRDQTSHAFENIAESLGKAITPAVDAVLASVRVVADGLTKLVQDNSSNIRAGALSVAESFVSAIVPTVQLAAAVAGLAAEFGKLPVLIGSGLVELVQFAIGKFAELELVIERGQLALQSFGATVFGGPIDQDLKDHVAFLEAFVAEADKATLETAKHAEALTGAADAVVTAFQKTADAAAATVDTTAILAKLHEAAAASVEKESKQEQILGSLTNGTNQALLKRLEHLRGINGTTTETAGAAAAVADSTKEAAAATASLAGEAEQAAGSFDDMASSADDVFQSIGGGGGKSGGGGADAFGRHSGGSAGFDLSNLAGAESALSAATANLRGTHGSAFAGQTQVRAARGVVNQIQARVDALRAQAQQDATKEILDALDHQGILDPTARQSYIDQRLNEARRLGVVPTTGRAPVVAGFARI